jgi:hypothetical protein
MLGVAVDGQKGRVIPEVGFVEELLGHGQRLVRGDFLFEG